MRIPRWIVAWLLLFLPAWAGPGELTISVLGPFSGKFAFLGQPLQDGSKLALEDFKALGGIPGKAIKLQFLDENNDVTVAESLAQKAVKDGQTLAIIGPRVSETALAAGKVLREGQLPAMTASASAPEVTQDNPYFFCNIVDIARQGQFLADYGQQVLGCKSVMIVSTQGSPYSQALTESFKKEALRLGLEVKGEWSVPYRGDEVEARAAATAKLTREAGDPDTIYMLSLVEDNGALFLKHARQGGDRRLALSGQAMGNKTLNKRFEELAEEKKQPGFFSDGLFVSAIALSDTGGESSQNFYARYRQAFGHEGDPVSAAYYDATMMVLRGLRETGAEGKDIAAERNKLRDWLAQLNVPQKAHAGTTGKIFFNEQRSAVKSVAVGRFVSGKLLAAPIQLELITEPSRVPYFDESLAKGDIVKMGESYLAKVQVIYVGLDVVAIPEINQRTAEFTADMFIWFRYRGELPKELEFANASKPLTLGEPVWTRKSGDMTVTTFRVKGIFSAPMNFSDYPLDQQKLRITLRHRSKTVNSLILAADILGMSLRDRDFERLAADKLAASFASTTWRPVRSVFFQNILRSDSTLGEAGLNYDETGLEYSQINAVVEVRRDVLSYLLKNALPLGLVIIILYLSAFVPSDQINPRISVGITSLLTSMVLYQRLSGELPAIGYTVLMDQCFFLVFAMSILQTGLAVAEFTSLKFSPPRPRLARAIHLASRTVLPLTLLLFLAVLSWKYR